MFGRLPQIVLALVFAATLLNFFAAWHDMPGAVNPFGANPALGEAIRSDLTTSGCEPLGKDRVRNPRGRPGPLVSGVGNGERKIRLGLSSVSRTRSSRGAP